MRFIRSLWLLPTLTTAALAAQTSSPPIPAAETITELDVMRRVALIAHDSMMGRDTPSRGLEATAQYVVSEFRRAGLKPGDDNGDYLQRFVLTRWVMDTGRSMVQLEARGIRGMAQLGIDARYIDGKIPDAPVRGNVMLIAGHAPPGNVRGHIALLVIDYSKPLPASLGQRVFDLAARGPKAVLILSNRDSATFADRLQTAAPARLTLDPAEGASASAPVIEVHERALGPVLAAAGIDGSRLRRLNRTEPRILHDLTIEVRLARKILMRAEPPNVLGILEGSDPILRREYLAYSAHIDHIGITPGLADSINNGADDNASGVAGLLELVQAFAQPGARPKRSILFFAPSAEEPGLLGSAHFTRHPTIPLDRIVANVNMDLIGRNWRDSVIVVGPEYSDLGEILEQVVRAHPELEMTPIADRWPEERIFYRSDHYNFARKGVPILFFTSGTHADYHRPSDDPERINGEKESRLVRLLFHLGTAVANRPSRPRWKPESHQQIVERH
jgi:hypothetical protein